MLLTAEVAQTNTNCSQLYGRERSQQQPERLISDPAVILLCTVFRFEYRDLERFLWPHARQQQRCQFDFVLPTCGASQASNLENTLFGLGDWHIRPELLTG